MDGRDSILDTHDLFESIHGSGFNEPTGLWDWINAERPPPSAMSPDQDSSADANVNNF